MIRLPLPIRDQTCQVLSRNIVLEKFTYAINVTDASVKQCNVIFRFVYDWQQNISFMRSTGGDAHQQRIEPIYLLGRSGIST